MTQQLRDELARLGEQASDLRVDPDLWSRGRRAHRRDQVLTAAAVLVLVAVLGGITSVLTADRTPAPAESPDGVGGGAVPRVIHLVPERFVQFPESPTSEVVWDERVAETDLSVGRASLAYAVGRYGSLPVVVTAEDGRYHPLVLPGWAGAGSLNSTAHESIGLALSPDGRSLAYAWWDPTAPLDAPMPAGVRVVDLETGDVRTIPLEGGNGVLVTGIVWSPDSRWLAWQGWETKSWTPGSLSSGHEVVGRVAPEASTSEPVTGRVTRSEALAIDSRGAVTGASSDGRTTTWDGRTVRSGGWEQLPITGQARSSPDGSLVALGTRGWGSSAWFVEPSTGELLERALAKDLGRYPEGAEVSPLGWLDASLVAAVVAPLDDGAHATAGRELVVMTAPSEPVDRWTYRIVGGIAPDEDSAALQQLTVAVDLMTLEHPTEHFPDPEWPMSDERKVALAGLALAGLLAAAYLLVLWRRRRE